MFINLERKHVIAVIICAVLMIASIVAHNIIVGKVQASYDAVRSEVSSLQSQIDVAYAAQSTQQQSTTKTVGPDESRLASDGQVLQALLDRVCDWNSTETYEAVRTEIMNEYGFNESSSFVLTIMPRYRGEDVNKIDKEKLKLSFDKPEPTLISFFGAKYDYIASVNMKMTPNGDAKAATTTPIFLTYSVDNDGVISNLKVATLAS